MSLRISFISKYLVSFSLILSVNTVIAQTEISGGIFEDDTWDLSGSPYIIKENTVIFVDATITVEPGVEIKFEDNVNLRIQGELYAVGTSTDVISITSNSSSPTNLSWEAIYCEFQSKIVFEHVNFRYSELGIQFSHLKPSHISNSNFEFNNIAIDTDGGTSSGLSLDSTTFQYNTYGIYAVSGMDVTHCIFQYNSIGANLFRSNIAFCSFNNNDSIGLTGSTSIILHSIFENNSVGLQQSFSGGNVSSKMTENTINNNRVGLRITGNNPLAVFKDNIICHNTEYNVVNTSSYSGQDLGMNCWCTKDLDFIAESIYDAREDINLGLVTFEPIRDQCDNITSSIESNIEVIIVFPNPVKNSLFVNQNSQIKFSIVSIGGKHIKNGIARNRIDMTGIPTGIYILLIEHSDSRKSYHKIFKS